MSNKETLLFYVPSYVDEDEIKDYFIDNFDDLIPALDLCVADERAHIDDYYIANFELYSDRVVIEYVLEYSAYYGCKDMDYVDEDQRLVFGKRDGRRFEFTVFVPPPKPTTYEEF